MWSFDSLNLRKISDCRSSAFNELKTLTGCRSFSHSVSGFVFLRLLFLSIRFATMPAKKVLPHQSRIRMVKITRWIEADCSVSRKVLIRYATCGVALTALMNLDPIISTQLLYIHTLQKISPAQQQQDTRYIHNMACKIHNMALAFHCHLYRML